MSMLEMASNEREPLRAKRGHRPAHTPNVAGAERMASALAGGALLAWSLGGRRTRWLPLAIGGSLIYRGVTGQCSLYHALGINTARDHSPAIGVRARHGCKIEHSLSIQRPAEELYAFWRNVANLPRIMRHVDSIEVIDERRSRWVFESPTGAKLAWDVEIFNERQPELIAWRSLPDSEVDTAGSVHFKPLSHGRGTLLTISMKYDPPGGKFVAALAGIFDTDLEARIKEDLRRFKNLAEAGEIPTTEGQPRG
jgi:uncharacterized membrane protein